MIVDNLYHILDKLKTTQISDFNIVVERLQTITENYEKELKLATKDIVNYGSRRVVKNVGKDV